MNKKIEENDSKVTQTSPPVKTKWGHKLEPYIETKELGSGNIPAPISPDVAPRTPALQRKVIQDIRRFGIKSDGVLYLNHSQADEHIGHSPTHDEIVKALKDAFQGKAGIPLDMLRRLDNLREMPKEAPRTRDNMPNWVKDLPAWQQDRWLQGKSLEGFDADSTADQISDKKFWGTEAED